MLELLDDAVAAGLCNWQDVVRESLEQFERMKTDSELEIAQMEAAIAASLAMHVRVCGCVCSQCCPFVFGTSNAYVLGFCVVCRRRKLGDKRFVWLAVCIV